MRHLQELARFGLHWLHIGAGTLVLIAGMSALLSFKGGKSHRRWGQTFLWAIITATATAALIASYYAIHSPDGNVIIGLSMSAMGFYFATSGYAEIRHKANRERQRRARITELSIATFLLSANVGLLLALSLLSAKNTIPGAIIREILPMTVILAILSFVVVGSDVYRLGGESFQLKTGANTWFIKHMSKMVAAFTLAITAFSRSTLEFIPTSLSWFVPTIIASVGIVSWRHYYVRQPERRPVPVLALEIPSESPQDTSRRRKVAATNIASSSDRPG